MFDFLKRVPLFASLPETDLQRLCEMVEEIRLPAGATLFTEGSPGDKAYVIQEGQIEILKSSGGRNVQLAIRRPGDVIGEMSLLESAPRFASGRALTDCVLLSIAHSQLDELLNTSPSAARAMLYTVTSRLRSSELLLRQSEKMAQLGTLTAGIAHELNNPAAAVQRGVSQLQAALVRLQEQQRALGRSNLTEGQQAGLLALDERARGRAGRRSELDSLARSDREGEVESWFADQEIEDGWELAPGLVEMGFSAEDLQELKHSFGREQLPTVLRWLEATFDAYDLLAEITQGVARMADIVKSLRAYIYLDQAPVQPVDIHEGLENTLVILRHKLKQGVSVKREYEADLPRLQAYGSELNQVWTNLIDNAIDAMDGRGEIVLRTRRSGDWVIVEVEDNGPGIPEEIQGKLFSPFFTTKPVGKGTGLGLNISYNIVQKHGGEIKVFSQPGKTRFQVCLPINFEQVQSGEAAVTANSLPGDEELRRIYESTKTIAVVGASDRAEQPNHTVPAYLQSAGYRILPVNPNITEMLGEKAYDNLVEIEEPIDVVLVFRRSEAVPEIVEQAIRAGARVVWMQEGVVNEGAAAAAREAGLTVVMDTCMRATHRRLFGK